MRSRHFLAIGIVDGIVVENQHHAGESEQRLRAQRHQFRQPVHLDFDGDGDLLLHFLGGTAGPLRDDVDVIVGDVGIGFDGQVLEGDRAPDGQQDADGENHEPVAESEIDELLEHAVRFFCR